MSNQRTILRRLTKRISLLSTSVLGELLRDYLSCSYAAYQAEELEQVRDYMTKHHISYNLLAVFVLDQHCQAFYGLN